MSSEAYELEVHRSMQSAQALNCHQVSPLGQSYPQSSYGWIQAYPCPSSLGDYEISIQQIGQGEPLLNYGPKLRLLMADPFKGIDLREAIAKLKIALKEAIQI
jgi:hypothetical protein